jgi:hypothetical protein
LSNETIKIIFGEEFWMLWNFLLKLQ